MNIDPFEKLLRDSSLKQADFDFEASWKVIDGRKRKKRFLLWKMLLPICIIGIFFFVYWGSLCSDGYTENAILFDSQIEEQISTGKEELAFILEGQEKIERRGTTEYSHEIEQTRDARRENSKQDENSKSTLANEKSKSYRKELNHGRTAERTASFKIRENKVVETIVEKSASRSDDSKNKADSQSNSSEIIRSNSAFLGNNTTLDKSTQRTLQNTDREKELFDLTFLPTMLLLVDVNVFEGKTEVKNHLTPVPNIINATNLDKNSLGVVSTFGRFHDKFRGLNESGWNHVDLRNILESERENFGVAIVYRRKFDKILFISTAIEFNSNTSTLDHSWEENLSISELDTVYIIHRIDGEIDYIQEMVEKPYKKTGQRLNFIRYQTYRFSLGIGTDLQMGESLSIRAEPGLSYVILDISRGRIINTNGDIINISNNGYDSKGALSASFKLNIVKDFKNGLELEGGLWYRTDLGSLNTNNPLYRHSQDSYGASIGMYKSF